MLGYHAPMHWLKNRLHVLVPLAVMGLALALNVIDPGYVITDFRLKVFDYYQRLQPRQYQPAPVRFVDIDDESLARLGQWPWPRTLLAEMVARLVNRGTAVIVFDSVFAEADRTSPEQILPTWFSGPDVDPLLARALEVLPVHDELFAEVIEQSVTVAGFVLTADPVDRMPQPKWGFAHAGDDPRQFLPAFKGAVVNLPIIEAAATGNGSFNLIPERDGIVRRVPLLFRAGDQLYPSLSAETLRVIQGASTFIIKSSGANMETAYGEHTGINNVKIGRLVVPTTADGQIWIHFTEDVPERRIPAWHIFEDDFDAARVDGKILVVGTSAAGLLDMRATPLSPITPGALIHVHAIEQMLQQHFLSRPDWAEGLERVYLLVVGLFVVALLVRLNAAWCAAGAVAGIYAGVIISWRLYTDALWLLDPVGPAIVIVVVYITGSFINFLRSEAEKQQVRTAFGQYLSPALVEELAKNPDRLQLGGEQRNMTFLFCDIRGFTSISEGYRDDPQGLTSLINRFLTPMTDAILAEDGTIDKYMGDAIMAFWNAPLDQPDHPMLACEAARGMQKELAQLNEVLEQEARQAGQDFAPLRVGIGINSGECVVGNLGSRQRFDYSVLGDAVNLASRLEGQTKNYGVGIILGEDTVRACPETNYATLELDLIAVKGKQDATRIFTILGGAEKLEDKRFKTLARLHQDMLAAYRGRDWAGAGDLATQCRQLDSGLGALYDLYENRIADYRETPPGPDWGGVYVAETK